MRRRIELPNLSTHLWWTDWHPSGDVLPIAFSGSPEIVSLIDRNGGERMRLLGHARGVNCAAWCASRASLFTTSHDGTVRIWNVDGECLQVWELSDSVESLSTQSDGRVLFAATRDGHIWKIEEGRGSPETLVTLECAPSRVALSPDERRLAVANESDAVRLFDRDGHEISPPGLVHPIGPVYSLAFAPDGRLATASDDGVVRIFSQEGRVLAESDSIHGRALQVAWTSDGNRLAAGYHGGVARIFDRELREAAALQTEKEVTLLAWTPTGDVLAVGSGRGPLVLADVSF